MKHIQETYHDPMRAELDRLDALAGRVIQVHGDHWPQMLVPLADAVRTLSKNLRWHTRDEDEHLFPAIVALDGRQPIEMHGRRLVSAEAVDVSAALAWTSTTMRRLLESENRIALNALRFVSGRLYDLQRRYRQLMTERIERRVARTLLRLVHDAGRRVESGVEIDFPISRQDIAEMTGTTLYTVSRLLSGWEERGLLRSGRQRIILTNAHALVAIAEDLPGK